MYLDLILFCQLDRYAATSQLDSGLAIKSELALHISALIEMIKSYLSINPALNFRRKILQFNYGVKFTLSDLPIFAVMS